MQPRRRMPRLPHSCCHVSPVQRAARWPSQETNDLFGPKEKNESMAGSHLDLDLNILRKVWICACLESYDGFLSKCGILVFCKIKVWIGNYFFDQAMTVHMLATGSKNEEVRSQWLANEQLRRRNVLKYLKHNKSTAQV